MRVLIILICIMLALSLFGERLTTFPQLSKPEKIRVGENLICINEGAVVFLYDLNTFKLIKKFGRKGEGPGEFPSDLNINILKEKIIIESKGKILFYSLKGDLIKEKRFLPTYRGLRLLGDRYFASSGRITDMVYHNVVKILDADFKEIKTFYQDEAGYHQEKQVTNYASTWDFDVSENKFFIVGSSAFKIDVFNKNGDLLYTISPQYERVKFPQEFIDAWFERTKRRRGMNMYYLAKQRVRWPEFFPAIRDLIVDNGHVYVITWRRKEQKSEFLIFDLEGKLVKKTFVPLQDYDDGVVLFPYSIKNNFLYQLIDNEDTEVWELHRFSIVEQGKLSYDDLIGKYLGADWVRPEVGKKVKIYLYCRSRMVFNGGRFYQLLENEETETWELHVNEVN